MNTEEKDLNPYNYQYKPNDMVEIPGNVLLNLMIFCEKVMASQPTFAVPYVYADEVKVKKDKDGKTLDVKTTWKEFDNIESFLKTIENPIRVATELTILSEQTHYGLNKLHQKNIESGLAKKIGELTKEQENTDVDKILKKAK